MRHQQAGHAGQGSAIQGRRAVALAVGLLACLLLAPAMASASSNIDVTPIFPTSVAVGDSGVSAEIVLTNSNSGTDTSATFCNFNDAIPACAGSPGITLLPSCVTLDFSGCSPAGTDPNVFAINPTAIGAPASACPGRSFNVQPTGDAAGTVRFTPASGNLTIANPGTSCRIVFSFNVLKLPADALPATGLQTNHRIAAFAVSNNNAPTSDNATGDVTVKLAAPALTDTDPDSPANDNAPEIKGAAPAGTTLVSLYANAICSGSPVITGSAADFASPGFTVNVPGDLITTFSANVTDSAGGVSACSDTIGYVEDSTPPIAPTLTDTDPDSPSNDNTIAVKGSAEAGTTVRVYTNNTCSGAATATGSAALLGSTGLPVTVAPDVTTTFYATATDVAGNVSPCSATALAYVEDSTPPAAPSIGGTDPAGPSNDDTPLVGGVAPAGTIVRIYTNPACNGTPAGEGSAATFSGLGIETTVPQDATSTLYATATDAAGNVSACASTGVTYVEDSTDPAVAVLSATAPASPANDNAPRVRGTAPAGTTVNLYTNASCTGAIAGSGSAAALASPGLAVSVADNSTTTFYARTTDQAANVSGCSPSSVTYVEDSAAPETTLTGGPSGVEGSPTPTFTFSSTEAAATFECRIDSGAFVPCTSPFTTPALAAGTHTFEVRSRDGAGNVDGSSATRQFTVSATVAPPPPPPVTPPPPPPVTPPPPPAAPQQPGCSGITGTLYTGTAGANVRTGTSRTDIMFGRGGNDTLRGAAGLDCLYGEAGSDRLLGGNGADRLFGGTGNDRVDGSPGNDTLSGQGGNDRLNGGTGNDRDTGGAGRDVILDRRGTDRFSGGSGNDRIDARDSTAAGKRGRDRILCGAGVDTVLADPRDSIAKDCERGRITRRSLR